MSASSSSFLLNFLRDPQSTGAVAPATSALARRVANAAHEAHAQHRLQKPGEALRIVELGAGTGALTRQLGALQPVLVERDPAWAALLRDRFPALEVRQACAMQVLEEMTLPTGVVCSIPLLNNPQSRDLKRLIARRYADGTLRFFVLYTYGWKDPLAGYGFRHARRAAFVARSLPPAHVWSYQ